MDKDLGSKTIRHRDALKHPRHHADCRLTLGHPVSTGSHDQTTDDIPHPNPPLKLLQPPPNPPPFRRIGSGFCGSVWTDPTWTVSSEPIARTCGPEADYCDTGPEAIKREDGGPGRSLLKEYKMHRQLIEALYYWGSNSPFYTQQVHGARPHDTTPFKYGSDRPVAGYRIDFPYCHKYLEADDPKWTHLLTRFPPGYTACNALVNKRIPTMPLAVRRLLVERYCYASLQENILQDVNNEDCLVRIYLGRRKFHLRPDRPKPFSLRNFPLHIDQAREIGLPAEQYALAMADALAFIYWHAKLDANDVEFVLAPPRLHPQSGRCGIGEHLFDVDTLFGNHTMWVLDFDCCDEMAMDGKGVKKAAKAFLRNDPYFPRPHMEHFCDVVLWERFKERFLGMSGYVLREEDEAMKTLPQLLIDEIGSMRAECLPKLFEGECEACTRLRGRWRVSRERARRVMNR